MKKISKKIWPHHDSIVNEVSPFVFTIQLLIAFFNASIGVADPNTKVVPSEILNYKERKKLSTELTKYMPRELRPRYKEIMCNFYNKYEKSHSGAGQSSKRKTDKQKVSEAKQTLEEIARKRAELKKLSKKAEIDNKLKKPENQENKEEDDDEKELEE